MNLILFLGLYRFLSIIKRSIVKAELVKVIETSYINSFTKLVDFKINYVNKTITAGVCFITSV